MSVNKVNKTTGALDLIAGGTLFADNPIGSIIPYGGATAPAGWFICDGTELVRATYPELFAVIGTSFGTPSDNTKFKLPDLREATTKGVGLTGKSNNHYDSVGLALGEFINDRIQDHVHANSTVSTNPDYYMGFIYGTGGEADVEYTGGVPPTTTRRGNTTEVKAVGVNYIIKAKSIGIPADFMSAVDSAVDTAMGNITTSGITEVSALPNLGTAANANQHTINWAINDKYQYDDDTYQTLTLPTPETDFSNVNITAKRSGNVVTLNIYLEATVSGSTHLSKPILAAGALPTKYRPSQQVGITSMGYRDSETAFTTGRFFITATGAILLGECLTINEDTLTHTFTFPFTVSYVV